MEVVDPIDGVVLEELEADDGGGVLLVAKVLLVVDVTLVDRADDDDRDVPLLDVEEEVLWMLDVVDVSELREVVTELVSVGEDVLSEVTVDGLEEDKEDCVISEVETVLEDDSSCVSVG